MNLFEWFRPKPRVTVGIGSLGFPADRSKPILDATGKPYADQRRSKGPDVNVHRLYAREGEQIVCDEPAQHLIAEFTNDIWCGDFQNPANFDFSVGVFGKSPGLGTLSEDCKCPCGGHWFAGGNYHFKDGWR